MTADDLAALEAKMTPGPWRWKQTGPIDWGFVGPGDVSTVLFGERYEGAVDADDTDAVALVALRNHARLLIAALLLLAVVCAAWFIHKRAEEEAKTRAYWDRSMRERGVYIGYLGRGDAAVIQPHSTPGGRDSLVRIERAPRP